jgi:hypothetical protein
MRFLNTGSICLIVALSCGLQASGAKARSLPPGVLTALASDEQAFCDQFLGQWKVTCHQTFRAHLLWRELLIAPSRQTAILIENHNVGFCGSAGCSIYLFLQRDATCIQVLETHGDTGTLRKVKVLKSITNGHYDLQKTWADDKTQTIYRWNGSQYSAN